MTPCRIVALRWHDVFQNLDVSAMVLLHCTNARCADAVLKTRSLAFGAQEMAEIPVTGQIDSWSGDAEEPPAHGYW